MKELLDKWYEQSMQYSPVRVAGVSRKRLMQYYGEHGLTKGAEIGVDRGRFSEYMFKVIPNLELLCVDPWHWKLRGESRYQSTVKRLEPYNATVIRKTSLMASLEVPNESLDFVYIDGDHTFDFVMMDIILWAPKVKFGGVISGHDYYGFRRAGVIEAVNAYTNAHGVVKWFLTDYQKDRTPSWFWIREKSFGDVLEEQD